MREESWEVIETVAGDLKAELIGGLLQAQGIPVVLSQEGVGRSVYPVTFGLLGNVDILVPSSLKAQALQVLHDYHAGIYAQTDLESVEKDAPASKSENS